MPREKWDTLSRSERLRQAFTSFTEVFPPNPYKYGVLRGYGEGGKKNVYTSDFQEQGENPEQTWPTLLAKHFQREDVGRIGYLPGTRAGTNVGCIDVDKHVHMGKLEHVVRSVVDAAIAEGLQPLLEESTNGGWHIWVWCTTTLPYEVMRDALRHIIHKADVGVLETYPMGSMAGRGRWVFMPYAGAAVREDGLGRTYLEDTGGQKVPIWSLAATVKRSASPRRLYEKLAKAFEKRQRQVIESTTEPAELGDNALEQLRRAAAQPPDGFDRHHSVFAFVNVAERAGKGREMIEYLQSEEIWRLWVQGRPGERSPADWVDELERIWVAVQEASDLDARRYGLPFLAEMGWEVPELERRVENLGATQGWTKAVDDDLAAQWTAAQLEKIGEPLAMESGTPFLYVAGTWSPLPGIEDAVRHVVEKVLRPTGARIKQDQARNRVTWMLRQVVPRELSKAASPYHIAVRNGVVDLRTGKLEPFSRDLVTIGRAPIVWERMSKAKEEELLEPLRAFLRESMRQDENMTDELLETLVEDYFRAWAWAIDPGKRGRFFLDFHGPTSTGKSTAVRAAMLVLGDAGGGDALGLWTSLDSDSMDMQEFTTALIGRQGVHFDDLSLTGDRRSDKRVVNFFKKVAGGTTLAVNRKFQPVEHAVIHARVVISTNTIMAGGNSEDTAALNMRAWRLGFFGRSVDRSVQQPDFEQHLLPTEQHRLALFRTFVRYWQEFDKAGGVRSKDSVSAQRKVFAEFEHHQYPELTFLQMRCTRGTREDVISTSMLTEAYNDWAKRNNERQHDTRTLGAAMKVATRHLNRRGWHIQRCTYREEGAVVRGWSGLKLRWTAGSDVIWDDSGGEEEE